MNLVFSIKKVSLALLVTMGYLACELAMDYAHQIDLKNNAEHSIGYYFATGGKHGTYYPDSLPLSNEYIMYDIRNVLSPGLEQHFPDWKSFFEELPQDTLSVFIFHADTLKKYSWEEIRDGYKVLKRYDLSLEDLEETDFTITYP